MGLLEAAAERKLPFSPIFNESVAMPGKAAKVILTEKQQVILIGSPRLSKTATVRN